MAESAAEPTTPPKRPSPQLVSDPAFVAAAVAAERASMGSSASPSPMSPSPEASSDHAPRRTQDMLKQPKIGSPIPTSKSKPTTPRDRRTTSMGSSNDMSADAPVPTKSKPSRSLFGRISGLARGTHDNNARNSVSGEDDAEPKDVKVKLKHYRSRSAHRVEEKEKEKEKDARLSVEAEDAGLSSLGANTGNAASSKQAKIPESFKVMVDPSRVASQKSDDLNRSRPIPTLSERAYGSQTIGDYENELSSDSIKSSTYEDSKSTKSSFRRRPKLFRNYSSSDSTPSVSSTHKGKEIELAHPEYEVTYDMMLGIRIMIGATYRHKPRDLTPEDFEHVAKMSFPSGGSSKTPAHKCRDFKFKDYHPEVFRRIREKFGIDAAEYTMTVTNNPYLEFISNSKSGQFFFFTFNKQFMIKTMSKEECKFLRKILPVYYKHMVENPNSLLTRYYGIHRVQPAGFRKIRFLIMGSVFFTEKFIHENYDLKGSTYGRAATAKEKLQKVPVLKDLDFLANKVRIKVAPQNAELLVRQVDRDAQFLQSLNIMDYSLLLGMHYLDRPVPTESGLESKEDLEMQKISTPDRRQSHYGLKNQQVVLSSTIELNEELPLHASVKAPPPAAPPSDVPSRISSVFCQDYGGVRGVDENGEPSNVIYYMGIIDILQKYNAKKRFETTIKSISTNVESLSSVKPSKYATRFAKFIADAVDVADSVRKEVYSRKESIE